MRLSRRFLPWVVAALALTGGASLRPTLLARFSEASRVQDPIALPPPALTRALSLGYASALADLMFAHVLVAYGMHVEKKRLFELMPNYLDTITTLDPKFREPYRVADTLLTLQAETPPADFYRAARRIQDRGLQNFPYDTELWYVSGQFLGFLAPSQLPPKEAEEYRLEAARRLARACELTSSNENIPYNCLSAAHLFSASGQADAAQSFLTRVLAVSDNPEIHALAGTALSRILGQGARERGEERGHRFRAAWLKDLTFITREALLLLGPRFDFRRCAGRPSELPAECTTSFRAWDAQNETR